MQQKRLFLRETELRNSERAMTIQRSSIDARMRNNEIRQRRLEELHEEAEIRRAAAVKEVDDIESLLPNLEAQEMECLQRLQNSRVVTANVLEELEASLGQSSSVTNQLRLRGKSSMRNSFLPPERSLMSMMESHDELEEDCSEEMWKDVDGGRKTALGKNLLESIKTTPTTEFEETEDSLSSGKIGKE